MSVAASWDRHARMSGVIPIAAHTALAGTITITARAMRFQPRIAHGSTTNVLKSSNRPPKMTNE